MSLAWIEAEAAMPVGWRVSGLSRDPDEWWRAWALPEPHAGDPKACTDRGSGPIGPSGASGPGPQRSNSWWRTGARLVRLASPEPSPDSTHGSSVTIDLRLLLPSRRRAPEVISTARAVAIDLLAALATLRADHRRLHARRPESKMRASCAPALRVDYHPGT
jgi:hypothetical protein